MNNNKNVQSATGKTLDALTMEAILKNQLDTDDFMISSDTLQTQANAAEGAGYRLLAENLRRAAELTSISNEEILAIYETLRPGRTSYKRLVNLASHLENSLNAPRTAKLIREAAEAYLKRGFIEPADEPDD
jgi:propanediol dehydratase small subunit